MSKNDKKVIEENSEQTVMPMIIEVKINSILTEGKIRAFASVNLNKCFAITNIRIFESDKGLFIGMPTQRNAHGEYKDICFPVTKEFREQLNNSIIEAYNLKLDEVAKKQEKNEQSNGIQM